MDFKWEELKVDDLDYKETVTEVKDSLKSSCPSHIQDCGAIRSNGRCQCGNDKDSHHSLCTSCHSILPEDLQKDVDWCPEIYAAAIQYLTD